MLMESTSITLIEFHFDNAITPKTFAQGYCRSHTAQISALDCFSRLEKKPQRMLGLGMSDFI
ncbi:hypothetical protein ST37_08215 [Vibrio sp. qd031]|nr:hypothetical protein ST37_08215 [Vibrio sp. qd031]